MLACGGMGSGALVGAALCHAGTCGADMAAPVACNHASSVETAFSGSDQSASHEAFQWNKTLIKRLLNASPMAAM